MVNAGDNIRQLARQRKKQAIEKFAVAGVLIVAPFLVITDVEEFEGFEIRR